MSKTPQMIKKQLEVLRAERNTWEWHWQELTDYMLPRKNNVTRTVQPGTKRNTHLLDNTAMQSAELLGGALHGMLTNPASIWFELTTGDEALDQNDNVRKWLQDTTKRIHNALNNSNFQTEMHEVYLDLVVIGTAGQTILEDDEMDFRFNTYQINELYIRENHKGLIDEVYRLFDWEASKILREFKKENCPEEIIKLVQEGKDDKFKIIHCVYPNLDKEGPLPFLSKYILYDREHELRASGFNENPWIVPRWAKASGEVYGRSPGMTALPEAKTINLMTETMIRGAQKTIDPPLQAPDDGFVMPIRTKPGSINYYRSGSGNKDRIAPIFNDMRVDFGFQITDSHRMRIREAFFVDQLQLQSGPQMTATEVNTRTEEKMRLLGPVLGRMQVEYLRPMIDRVFGIMLRKKKFLPVPSELRQIGNLDVNYSSPIAKMQRISEADNIFRTIQAVAPFTQIDQAALDLFDTDAAVKGISKIYSFPQTFLRDEDAIAEIRAGRAKAQQEALQAQRDAQMAQNMGQALPGAAQIAKVAQEEPED